MWLREKVEITTVPVVSPDSLFEDAIALCLLMSSSTYLMSLCEHPPFSHRSGALTLFSFLLAKLSFPPIIQT